jgi:hypothetical protein
MVGRLELLQPKRKEVEVVFPTKAPPSKCANREAEGPIKWILFLTDSAVRVLPPTLGRGHAPRARRVGPNPRNVETDLSFPLSSEERLEVAALATVLGEVVAMAVAITVAAVALNAVVAAVALGAVVVEKIFLAFCVLWIWA